MLACESSKHAVCGKIAGHHLNLHLRSAAVREKARSSQLVTAEALGYSHSQGVVVEV